MHLNTAFGKEEKCEYVWFMAGAEKKKLSTSAECRGQWVSCDRGIARHALRVCVNHGVHVGARSSSLPRLDARPKWRDDSCTRSPRTLCAEVDHRDVRRKASCNN